MPHHQDQKKKSCLERRALRLFYLLFLQGATGVGMSFRVEGADNNLQLNRSPDTLTHMMA